MITLSDEWIVEQINHETKLMNCIGKIIFPQKFNKLTDTILDDIWDLCNYEPAQYESEIFNNGKLIFQNDLSVYNGMKCYFENGIYLVPMQRHPGYVNDDIFIRKHYDTENGYWIYNNHRKEHDIWKFSNKFEFLNYKKNGPF